MDFFNKNMDIVKQNRTYLYNQMQGCDIKALKDDTINIHSTEAKDGNLAVVIEKSNNSYRLNSVYKPIVEAEKWIEQYNFDNLNIIVTMFGLGNGIFAREIMKKLKDTDMLFILEPSADVFLHTLENYDVTDLLAEGRVSITVENINSQEIVTLLNQCVNWTNLDSMIVCTHPMYDKIFESKYHDFSKLLNDIRIRAIVNKNTEAFWGVIMTQNEIKNIKHLKNCNILSDFIEDIPKNLPAIIVSAGPSLDKNIKDLKKAKGKALIVAVDTSVKYLLAEDIIPDLVVTLDAKKSLSHFKDERFKSIPLLCKTVSNPDLLNLHLGKKIFFYNEKFINTIFEKLGKEQIYYNVGGCVSTAAFSVCVGLGLNRIVLIGQDLCYQGDVTHAGGKVLNAHGSGEGAMMYVEDIYGNTVKARYDWYTYLLWFQDAIAAYPNIDVIDATEGGAKIKGARILTLHDTIEQYCNQEINFEKVIEEKEPTFKKEELIQVRTYFNDSLKDLDKIKTLAEESVSICDRLIYEAKKNNIDSYSSQAMVKKISKNNKEIANKTIYQLLETYISKVSTKQLDTINQFTDDVINNQVKTYMKSKEVYKGIVDGANSIRPLFEDSLKEYDTI